VTALTRVGISIGLAAPLAWGVHVLEARARAAECIPTDAPTPAVVWFAGIAVSVWLILTLLRHPR